VNDALYFQRWLVDPTGGDVPERNVQLILSDSRAPGTRPTQQMVEDAMLVHIDRFKQTRLTQRRLYFFLSGHGISTGFGDLEGCRILMADASVDAIGVQTAGSILQRTPLFEEIVLFADSCREIEDDGFARNQLTIERAVKGLVKQAKDLDVRIMWGFASRWSQVVH